jgi:hypothetical protein
VSPKKGDADAFRSESNLQIPPFAKYRVRDRDDLKNKQEKFGFPSGKLLTPRDRQWTGKELNDYVASRPATQAELTAMFPDRAPDKVVIPKKKPNRLLEQVAAAPTAKKAKDIIAAATLAGELRSVSEAQLEALRDAVEEKGGAR